MSQGGGKRGSSNSRNEDYIEALDLILERIKDNKIEKINIYLSSKPIVKKYSVNERQLIIDDKKTIEIKNYSLKDLRNKIGKAQASFKDLSSKSEGNRTKRILISVPNQEINWLDIIQSHNYFSSYWIFRGNQDSFDVNSYLKNFNYLYWSVPIKKYQKEIKIGDKVFIWRSKGKSNKPYGIVAFGKIVEEPKNLESIKYPNNLGNHLWNTEDISDVKTGIRIESFRLDLESGLINSDILTSSEICSGMQLLTAKQGTNFKISHQQFEFIYNLWFGNKFSTEDDEEGSDESKTVLRLHRFRERDSGLVRKAKEKFIKDNGKLFCEVCKFDFNKVYGIDYAEAHHKKPLSKMKSGEKTKINDLAILCSNCHTAVHRLKVDDPLKELKGKFES